MTPEQFIQKKQVDGVLPTRAAVSDACGISQHRADQHLRAYLEAHPGTRRASAGVRSGSKLGPDRTWQQTEPVAQSAALSAMDDDLPEIVGVTKATKEAKDPAATRRALIAAQERAEKLRAARDSQVIRFRRGPIAITYQSDHHIGGDAVDYRALFAEQELIRSTPGMYVVSQGDETNNMIVSKLERVRREAPITISEEDETIKEYWAGFGDKLLAIVLGNHNGWAYKLAGRDPFFNLAPAHVLFDAQEIKFTLEIAGHKHRHTLRHKVRGSSMYNTLHGAKQNVRMRDDAEITIAGHIHRGACYEVWYDRGDRKIAGSLGTYKFTDEYDREEGFLGGGQGRTLTIVFDEQGRSTPFDDLALAADFLGYLRRQQ